MIDYLCAVEFVKVSTGGATTDALGFRAREGEGVRAWHSRGIEISRELTVTTARRVVTIQGDWVIVY